MLRTRLLPAVASAALLAASGAVAQTAPAPTRPVTPATPATAATPAAPAAGGQAATPATPATPASPASAARPAAAGNVIEVLTAQGTFTTLLAALEAAQLTQVLSAPPAVTIFAPTDEAFEALPEAERTRLMDPANRQELRSLLLYHVIVADVTSAQIMGARGGVETANRTHVLLDGTGEGLRIDGATIIRADIDASNGAVFAIDKVLNPAESMATPAATAPAAPAAPGGAPETEAPVSPTTAAPASQTGVTATTRPASPGATAPNGQPSAVTTTIASPPVPNPTDGQVDRRPDPSRTTPPGG